MAVRRIKLQSLVMTILAVLNIAWLGGIWWFSGNPFIPVRANDRAQTADDQVQTAAVIPAQFSYQGILRAADGTLVNGTIDITLNLYNVVTGGTPLHSETFTGVNVRDGVFSVVVGDTTPIGATVFDNAALYIGINVNGDGEMLPRQRLHPVPWAMQASKAQTAVTANGLIQGGGVAGLISFGTGGASEIAFAPNGGKITNSAAGMEITGGTNSAVTTAGALSVGGDLTVGGNWTLEAVHEIGDSNNGQKQRADYPVTLQRYVLEAKDAGSAPDTVPLDDAILVQLCQDEDGCTFNLAMRDWEDGFGRGLLANYGPYHFTISAVSNDGKRHWRIQDGFTGGSVTSTDGDAVVTHVLNIYDACFFTDGTFTNGGNQNDSGVGFGLLNWHGAYDSIQMTCVLMIED